MMTHFVGVELFLIKKLKWTAKLSISLRVTIHRKTGRLILPSLSHGHPTRPQARPKAQYLDVGALGGT